MKNHQLWIGLAIVGVVVGVPLWLKAQNPPLPVEPAKLAATAPPAAAPLPKKLPKFVDIGTTSCAPCKVMMAVLGELEAQYPDRLAIEFINTHQRPEVMQELGLRAIPSQLFLAPDGKELFRHTGVMRAAEVVAKWRELGYPLDLVDGARP
ncbi:MAG: thioredoxin family protein [Deltaproteobacteria bacterium]|nr:thioredoxin family protein [Deltaproteobacteria bacterium]